jgi:hypothetical protein
MSVCKACGGEITIAQDEETGDIVPLELFTASAGPDRYRILVADAEGMEHRTQVFVRKLPADSPREGYVDHRVDCDRYASHN